MRALIKVILPFAATIAIICISFIYFVYPSLSLISAYMEMGDLRPVYRPGDKLIVPGEIVNVGHRASCFLVLASVYSPSGAVMLPDKLYYLAPGERQRYYFEMPISSSAVQGKYRFQSRVKVKIPGKLPGEIAKVEREFDVMHPQMERLADSRQQRSGIIVQKSKPKYLRRIVRLVKSIVPLTGNVLILEPSVAPRYGSPYIILAEVLNTSTRKGEFRVTADIKDPLGMSEKISQSVTVDPGQKRWLKLSYAVTPDKPEGVYTVDVSLFMESNANPEYTRAFTFTLDDAPPSIALKSMTPAAKEKRAVEFLAEALDDKEVKEVYFVFSSSREPDERNYPMSLSSGDERRGVWSCMLETPHNTKWMKYSFLAIDSRLQKTRTQWYRIGG